MLEDPPFSSKISPFISCSSGNSHDFPPFDDVSTCRNVDYKKHLGDSIDVYHLCLLLGRGKMAFVTWILENHGVHKTCNYDIYIYISHMLHVWYIYLQNWVILFGHFCWVSNWLPCVDSHPYSGWWFGTWFFSPYIGNVIIPTDEHIFQGVGIPPTSININKLPIHTNMHIT